MVSGAIAPEEREFLVRLSELATVNPFLPERIDRERAALGPSFEEVSVVWSKRLDRANPNVRRLAERSELVAKKIRERSASGARLAPQDARLVEELVFYLLYYRYESAFDGAMGSANGDFYDDFIQAAGFHLRPILGNESFEKDLPHWFAFLFQIRRASHHIFDFILGGSIPAARLRAAVWESIFTHDLRRYRRSLYDRMGDLSTLVTGPSGTGKELVAQAIGLSRYIPFDPKKRRFALELGEAFFPLNLSALAPTLIESELFGHRRGAFTGALSDRKGWLSVCPELGTVFLDEIGELDPSIQVKLLRVLQTREFQALGETKTSRFEGKIVAATNRDLVAEMRSGRFREDLYYRLCSDLVRTPSLRDQILDAPEDLPELVRFIARRIVGPEEADDVVAEVLAYVDAHLGLEYPWPGNVRELEQCVRNIVIRREYRPPTLYGGGDGGGLLADELKEGRLTAEELVERYCALVYERTGSYLEAARRLGLDRRTVKSKVESFQNRR